MSEELLQNESHSESSKFNIFLKFFSFLIPLFDVIKLVIASVTSVLFLAFAGLTLAGSALALVVSTPLFLIFSPILVPATIATTLLATGLTAGATLGLSAIGLIMGLIRTGKGTSSAPTPLKLLKFSGGYGGSFGGKTFSGTFGDKSAGGAAPAAGGAAPAAGGGKPGGGFTWSWDGKSISGNIPEWLKNQPWFKNIPMGGGTPAGDGAPAAGGAPAAAGGAEPAGGSTPPS